MNNCNQKCQIFTPTKYAKFLLSCVNYKTNLFGNKILENSFGDGAILIEVVRAYIDDCRNNNDDVDKIIYGLENDIYGYEIDREKYSICLNRLNQLLIDNGIMKKVNWNLKNEDFLRTNINLKFNYIVGNPPYISYKELGIEERHFLNNSFESCKYGRFDYCFAFIEKSLLLLDSDGEMSYLIPNSIYKNVSASNLRNMIKPFVYKILDNYGAEVFPDVNVTTSIICIKNKSSYFLDYFDNINDKSFKVAKNSLRDKWVFLNKQYNDNSSLVSFGTVYNVGSTPATLLNKAFVFVPDDEDELYFYVHGSKIEKEIVKKAASPKSIAFSRNEYIIFPYVIDGNIIKRFDEEMFKHKYPYAFSYLELFKDGLKAKNNENGVNWFEYGRSQALTKMNEKKLMMGIIITNNVKVYELSKDEIPYSGIYITEIDSSFPLSRAKSLLESEEFMKYVNDIGITSSGKSKRITPNDVKKYKF